MSEKQATTTNPAGLTSQDILNLADAIRSDRPRTPLENSGLSPERQRALTEAPVPHRWRTLRCRSDHSGATFLAHVVESKTFPNGRILRMESYTLPDGMFTSVSNGGRVPDGHPINKSGAGPTGTPVPYADQCVLYKGWVWNEFYKPDLQAHNGKELKTHALVDPADLKTVAWNEGNVHVPEES